MPATLRLAATLGLSSAIGPFAIDMYLPAMPGMGVDLGASVAGVQNTLIAYFLAFGLAQLVYGPLADRFGRKPPLCGGLALFAAASVGCAFAPSVEVLVALRFSQGLGGAAVMVVPRALVRDLHTGPAAMRLMATIMIVVSISPMLAPLAGSVLVATSGWRAIFAVLAAVACLALLLTALALPETLAPERRSRIVFRSLLRDAGSLLSDRSFIGPTFIGGFGMASFFVFVASASFVYTGQFELTPMGFSLAFAINAFGFFVASRFAAVLGERHGPRRVILSAVTLFAAFAVALLGIVLAGGGTLPVIVAMLFGANACLGLVVPTVMVMALDEHGHVAGLASSLGGTLQMVTGGAAAALSGPFLDGSAMPMVAAIAVCAVVTFALTLWHFGSGSAPGREIATP